MNNIDETLVLAHFIVSDDVERSRRFYTEVLGGRVVFSGPLRADLCRAIQRLDHHQCRRWTDGRQAGGQPGDAARFRPGQQLPQYPGQGH
jgi:catechol 2,3-dioxygenase-like lactoylglutathione lyase family enzyme